MSEPASECRSDAVNICTRRHQQLKRRPLLPDPSKIVLAVRNFALSSNYAVVGLL